MRRNTWAPILVSLSLLVACGGAKTTSLTPSPSKEVIKTIPDWYSEPPDDSDHLVATATAVSADMHMAVEKAELICKSNLAGQLSTHLANLSKQFRAEIGVADDSELLTKFSSVTKAVTDETLVGARADKQKLVPEKDIYRAYVLMRLPIGKANQKLMEKIRSDQALLTELQATQAFKELEEELNQLRGH